MTNKIRKQERNSYRKFSSASTRILKRSNLLQVKPGSMNVLHNASIDKCSQKNPEALKNASNEVRKYEKTPKETRMSSELNQDISDASLASLALKSMTSQKIKHFKNPGTKYL